MLSKYITNREQSYWVALDWYFIANKLKSKTYTFKLSLSSRNS